MSDFFNHERSLLEPDSSLYSIADFFLNIFRLQLGLSASCPTSYRLVPSSFQKQHYTTFELKARKGDKWITRRMSLSALPKTSSGSSRCFTAIFDNLLVIKIPPKPVVDFTIYVDKIMQERRISDKIGPEIPFFAPGVTALLKNIQRFDNEAYLKPLELENKYIRWLRINPKFQECLKINNEFVFAMDLSRHMFFSQALSDLHENPALHNEIQEEIIRSAFFSSHISGPDSGVNTGKFMTINIPMNRLWSLFEKKASALFQQHEPDFGLSRHELQDLFFEYIFKEKIDAGSYRISENSVDELSRQLSAIVSANREVTDTFRQALAHEIESITLLRNRPVICGMIVGILKLLSHLYKKGVAIRDLKPDNQFIAGNPDRYPMFLANPDEYSIGLIDFETAIYIKKDRVQNEIDQPMKAGTLSYATPSNFYSNRLLKHIYKDIARIFFLQDWFAALAMIYQVLTGKLLFVQAGKCLRKIVETKQKDASLKPANAYIAASRDFWQIALFEFRQKSAAHKQLFESVKITIPVESVQILRRSVRTEKNHLAKTIGRYIESQIIFKSERNRKDLIDSSSEKIREYRNRWKSRHAASTNVSPDIRARVIDLLKNLEQIKAHYEQQKILLKALKQDNPVLNSANILDIIFFMVIRSMYDTRWGKLGTDEQGRVPKGWQVDDFDSQLPEKTTTVIYEDTFGI